MIVCIWALILRIYWDKCLECVINGLNLFEIEILDFLIFVGKIELWKEENSRLLKRSMKIEVARWHGKEKSKTDQKSSRKEGIEPQRRLLDLDLWSNKVARSSVLWDLQRLAKFGTCSIRPLGRAPMLGRAVPYHFMRFF